jgi:hypothetical protein
VKAERLRYGLAEREEKTMAISVTLDKVLDKQYESLSLADLVNAPVSALAGVSEGDAQLLQQAFNIKTVGDLGRNKFLRVAVSLVELAERTG